MLDRGEGTPLRWVDAAIAGFLAALAISSAPRQATAAEPPERVALASTDREFQLALRAALAATGVSLVEAAAPAELASADAGAAARGIAQAADASIVVWMVPQRQGSSVLAVYDRTADRIVTRPLRHGPPLAPEEAASAARMVRTMFRALRAGGDIEGSLEDDGTPVPDQNLGVQAAAAPPVGRGVRFEVGGGLKIGGSGRPAPAVTVSAAYYRRRLGIGLGMTISPSDDLEGPGVAGRHREDSLALTVRAPLRLARWVLEGAAGLVVSRTSLTAALAAEPGRVVAVERWNPGARIGASVALALTSWIEPVLFCEGDLLARRQRFLVGPAAVAHSSRAHATCGLAVRLGFP